MMTKREMVFAEVSAERDDQVARWSGAEMKKLNINRAFLGLWILELLPKVLDGTLTQIDENAWEVRVTPELLEEPSHPDAYLHAMKQIAAYACAALEHSMTTTSEPSRYLTPTYLDSPRRILVDRLVDGALRSGPSDVLRIYRWIKDDVDQIEQEEIVAAAERLGARQRDGRWAWWAGPVDVVVHGPTEVEKLRAELAELRAVVAKEEERKRLEAEARAAQKVINDAHSKNWKAVFDAIRLAGPELESIRREAKARVETLTDEKIDELIEGMLENRTCHRPSWGGPDTIQFGADDE